MTKIMLSFVGEGNRRNELHRHGIDDYYGMCRGIYRVYIDKWLTRLQEIEKND